VRETLTCHNSAVKSRGRAFLVTWLLCLAAGIVAGFVTVVVVQAVEPPPPDADQNMAYGFYMLFWILGAANVTNYVVAVSAGARYVKRERGDLGRYLMKAIGFSVLAFVLTVFICPLILLNSLIAAGIAIACVKTGKQEARPSSGRDVDLRSTP